MSFQVFLYIHKGCSLTYTTIFTSPQYKLPSLHFCYRKLDPMAQIFGMEVKESFVFASYILTATGTLHHTTSLKSKRLPSICQLSCRNYMSFFICVTPSFFQWLSFVWHFSQMPIPYNHLCIMSRILFYPSFLPEYTYVYFFSFSKQHLLHLHFLEPLV